MSANSPSIRFRLESRSGIAPYRQLVAQVCDAVEAGRLRGGDRLPSVREVVTQITINPNTVHRAYRELEHQGIAEGRAGLGTFITPRAPEVAADASRGSIAEELENWTIRARALGLNEDDMIDELRRLINRDERVWS